MMQRKEWIGLFFVLICSGFTLAGLAECPLESAGPEQLSKMQITQFIPSNGYSYSFVNGARDISDGSDFDAVRQAFGMWIGQPTSALWAVETTRQTRFTPGRMNHRNEISWISPTAGDSNPWDHRLNLPDEMLAVVMVWIEPTTRRVLERDLYFNDVAFRWRTDSDGCQDGGYFVEHIALHEIGHLFGLRDVYNPGQSGWQDWMGSGNQVLTMYGYSSWQNEIVTLHETDIAAMALLHPVSVPESGSLPLFSLAAGLFLVTSRR